MSDREYGVRMTPITDPDLLRTLHVASATAPQPRTRIRVEHSRTIKEGWGYSTTVEVTYDGDGEETDEDALSRLETLLAEAREFGERERHTRNSIDRHTPSTD